MLAAGVLAFALAGAQLIPTLEYLSDSHRSTMLDPESAMQYSFAPWRSLGLLVPDLFGNPARGDFWGYGNFWEDAIYVGVMPFLFAVLSLVRGIGGRDGRKKLIRFLAALSAVVLLLALGKNTPIFPWLFDNVPTFNLFQAPARWNLILTFSLALLAAFGADAWRAPEGRSLYWMRLATAGAAMLALSAWLIGMLAPEIEPTFTRSFGLAGIWLFIFCLLALLRPKKLTLLWVGLLGLVVVADLGLTQWGLNPSAAASLYEGSSELANQTAADHRLYMPPDLEYEIKFERTHRFDTFESQIEWEFVRDVGLPNTTLLDGIPSANNFDPLLPERYAVWMQALADLPLDEQESRLALMDVGWRAKEDPESSTGVSYVAVEDPARVRIIYEAIWEQDPGAALDQLMDPAFDPSRSVVLEGIEEHWATAGGTGAILRFEQVNPGHLEIEAASSGNGWLVLSDTWNSGWRATVDEVETEILQADYLFRAIRIPAGEHEIVFRYQPVATLIGFVISGLAWLLVGGMVWLWRRD
jgi:hypothetical protein